jgi:hypothetical protein
MFSKVIFAISVLLVMYFLPIIILKGARGQGIRWFTFLMFAIGATGIVLFTCGIY